MERGLHSPAAKRISNLSDSAGNAVEEALENSHHSGRLSPRPTSASLHNSIGDTPTNGKFEIDNLFHHQHSSDSTSSSEISSSESRKKYSLYPELGSREKEAEMNSDVDVGCSTLRSPAGVSTTQLKENTNKGKHLFVKYYYLNHYLLSCTRTGESTENKPVGKGLCCDASRF